MGNKGKILINESKNMMQILLYRAWWVTEWYNENDVNHHVASPHLNPTELLLYGRFFSNVLDSVLYTWGSISWKNVVHPSCWGLGEFMPRRIEAFLFLFCFFLFVLAFMCHPSDYWLPGFWKLNWKFVINSENNKLGRSFFWLIECNTYLHIHKALYHNNK